MSLLDTIQQHLGPEQIQQISQHLGIDPATTNNAVQAALPMMVSGMAAHSSQEPDGASAIESAVDSHTPADTLGGFGNLAGMLGSSGGSGGGLLNSILGRHPAAVQNNVQTATNQDSSKTMSKQAMLAPGGGAARARRGAARAAGGRGGSGARRQ